MKNVLVLGAGGFIGTHLVNSCREAGELVVGVDIKAPDFEPSRAHRFDLLDLRDIAQAASLFREQFDEVYQLACNMGGAGYIFTGENDADILHDSLQVNLNIARLAADSGARLFFSSSACVYPEYNQTDSSSPNCSETSVYPAQPDSEYGWEKLTAERLYLAFARNKGLDVRIARLHNVFGPLGAWRGGREKAPAALCRKVAQAVEGGSVEIWGDGRQTRSFLYIDECIDGIRRLMRSDCTEPVNLGSTEMVSILDLGQMITRISGKCLSMVHVAGPQGVRGRCSDNRLIESQLGWRPSQPLRSGLEKTYEWIRDQVELEARAEHEKEVIQCD